MVSTAGRFERFGEGASDHYSVRAASERFANIAASAHSPISDDWHVARRFFEVSIARRGAINSRSDLRHTESKHTTRSASRPGSNPDQNGSRPTFHDFKGYIITNSVPNDHRNAHLAAKLFQIKRLVL